MARPNRKLPTVVHRPSESADAVAPYVLSTQLATDELPATASALSEPLQQLARRVVQAQRRTGEALIQAADAIYEARNLADEGEWTTFLETIRMSKASAVALINIAFAVRATPTLRDLIGRGMVTQSVAALLARPTTPEVVRAEAATLALNDPNALTARSVQEAISRAREPLKRSTYPHSSSGEVPVTITRPLTPETREALARVQTLLVPYRANPTLLDITDRSLLDALAHDLAAILNG